MSREESAADQFARHKAGPVMRALAANLRTAADLPYLVEHDATPCDAMPAFIVGAGPSLSDALPLLPAAAKRGLVFAVNASARAVAGVVKPDVLVVRESLDVSAHLAGVTAGLVALDLCASPAVWEAAEGVGPRGWFLAAAVQHFAAHQLLRARAPYCGPSAVTAAVSLAEAWGCSPIVLVGCDLAFARDGQGYAPGSAWGDVRGALRVGGLVELDGLGAMHATARESGQRPVPVRQSVEMLPALDGGEPVASLLTWGDQVRWLANRAARTPGDYTWRVNASGGGTHVEGWHRLDLEHITSVLDDLGPRAWYGAPGRTLDVAPLVAALLADAEAAQALAEGHVPPWLPTGVLEAMAAGDVLSARDDARGDVGAAIRGTVAAYADAGSWVEGVASPMR